jgi:hypothetical protein
VVRHMFKGVLFIHDESETENGGFFCAKAEHCVNTKKSEEVPPPPVQSFSEFVCGLHFVLIDSFSCIITIHFCFCFFYDQDDSAGPSFPPSSPGPFQSFCQQDNTHGCM